METAILPYVIESFGQDKERSYDLFSRLLKDRIIFIGSNFDATLANIIVAQLLYLEANDSQKDIQIYINSPGGEVDAMYGIYDVMNYINPDIVTVGYGTVCSAASFILAAGTKGKRYALPNANIMIHEMRGGVSGKAHDILPSLKRIESLRDKMAKDYVKFTGQEVSKIKKDMELDYFMSAEESKEYGLIDKIEYNRG